MMWEIITAHYSKRSGDIVFDIRHPDPSIFKVMFARINPSDLPDFPEKEIVMAHYSSFYKSLYILFKDKRVYNRPLTSSVLQKLIDKSL